MKPKRFSLANVVKQVTNLVGDPNFTRGELYQVWKLGKSVLVLQGSLLQPETCLVGTYTVPSTTRPFTKIWWASNKFIPHCSYGGLHNTLSRWLGEANLLIIVHKEKWQLRIHDDGIPYLLCWNTRKYHPIPQEFHVQAISALRGELESELFADLVMHENIVVERNDSNNEP